MVSRPEKIIDLQSRRNPREDFDRLGFLQEPRAELEANRYENMPETYFRCGCGGVYFFIAPHGLVCSECGLEPKGF